MRSVMRKKMGMALLLSAICMTFPMDTQAQMFVYPKSGQDQQTQMKDQQECQLWAQQQTGYNPASMASAPTYTASGPQEGSGLRGAAGGALKGAVIAGLADGDAGKGAAWGAGMGVVGGRMRSRRQSEEIAAAQNRAVQEVQAQGYGGYEKACKACLEGRGYSVN
jgi:hypothetical protein